MVALLSLCRVQLCWCGSICTRTPVDGNSTMIRAFGRVPWTAGLLKGFTVAARSRLACPSLSPLDHLLCSAYGQAALFPYYCAWGASACADRLFFCSFNKVEELGLSTRSGRHLVPKMGWVRWRKETGTCPCSGAQLFQQASILWCWSYLFFLWMYFPCTTSLLTKSWIGITLWRVYSVEDAPPGWAVTGILFTLILCQVCWCCSVNF